MDRESEGRMKDLMDGWINRRSDGRMKELMDGWKNGLMDE